YLIADAIRGWMFTANVASRPLPYVVTRLDYTAPSNDESGRVFIELKANAKGSITTATLRMSAGDIVGRTVAEIFAAKGFL
ncbi:AAA family ATPase, partial [Acinetobacter baumannii]